MALRFFLGANSKDGFVSLFPRLHQEAPRRLYVVKSGPGCGKSTCISRLSEALGGAEELIFCSSDPDSLDGAVLQLEVPRAVLGLEGDAFYFKVADSVENPADIMDYYVTGRSMPMGRFSYQYLG